MAREAQELVIEIQYFVVDRAKFMFELNLLYSVYCIYIFIFILHKSTSQACYCILYKYWLFLAFATKVLIKGA